MRIKKECSLLLKVNVLLIFNKLPFKEEERTQKTITFICNQFKTEYYEFEIQYNNSGLSEMG